MKFIYDSVLLMEKNGVTANFTNATEIYNDYKIASGITLMCVSCLITALISFYLD